MIFDGQEGISFTVALASLKSHAKVLEIDDRMECHSEARSRTEEAYTWEQEAETEHSMV